MFTTNILILESILSRSAIFNVQPTTLTLSWVSIVKYTAVLGKCSANCVTQLSQNYRQALDHCGVSRLLLLMHMFCWTCAARQGIVLTGVDFRGLNCDFN